MPIASGAAGRVDVGGDPGPDGPRTKTKPANRNCDSYLQRYQELQERKKNKGNAMQGTEDRTDPADDERASGGSARENDGGEDHPSGEPLGGQGSKKSRLCVLL